MRFMQQHIALDYVMRVSPLSRAVRRPARRTAASSGTGARRARWCTCRRGRSARCARWPWADDDEVDLADQGTVTSYTVLTPIQYHGQQERDEYALASILLDGADGTVGQQRLVDVSLDKHPHGDAGRGGVGSEERRATPAIAASASATPSPAGGPIDEPDVPEAEFAEHVL